MREVMKETTSRSTWYHIVIPKKRAPWPSIIFCQCHLPAPTIPHSPAHLAGHWSFVYFICCKLSLLCHATIRAEIRRRTRSNQSSHGVAIPRWHNWTTWTPFARLFTVFLSGHCNFSQLTTTPAPAPSPAQRARNVHWCQKMRKNDKLTVLI